MEINEGTLQRIKKRLLEYDPAIVEIVQFGSSVYAPELAGDLDLLVFTEEQKGDQFNYLQVLNDLDVPNVDIVLKEPGSSLNGLTLGVAGAHRIIYGEGKHLNKSIEDFNPSFDEAWAALGEAKDYMRSSKEIQDKLRKSRRIRNAFNELSHAARSASLAFLAKSQLGWRGIEKNLSSNLGKKFHEIFETLHVNYFYEGNYPLDTQAEFERWVKEVENYIKRLETEGRSK